MTMKVLEDPVKGVGSRSLFLSLTLPVLTLVAGVVVTFGVLRMRSDSPSVERSALQLVKVQSGPLVCRVQGLGTLVPEEVRWMTAGTDGHVDQIYLRAGAHVKPETLIMQLSNPDLDRQTVDAELSMKKSEAELANLRVQLQAQLLNEKALQAELEADATEAKLQADKDESLYKMEVGTAMNAKISSARADSLATRLKIEREKVGIAEEARQAQLTAKQAEVAQMQALYELRSRQKQRLLVRSGMDGVLEQVSVGAGQQVGPGTILAQVTNSSRLMARVHVPEAQASQIELNQAAMITLQDRAFAGRVVHIDPNVQNGTVSIDLKFTGAQPREARADLSAGGTIDVEKIPMATYVKWPLKTHAEEPLSLFRISPDGREVQRVRVVLGKSSDDSVQIAAGLNPGDQIIVSDTSAWKRYDHLKLK
jgi:HlyD family secretion protein